MDKNFLLVTLDSCRWDSYQKADMPFLKQHCPARRAYAQSTFTYPAHLAMFQGMLPGTRESLPYYNRHTQQLIRISNRGSGSPGLVMFPPNTTDIVTGFRSLGYFTLGLGAMDWFQHPYLTQNFEEFYFTGTHAQKQVETFLDRTEQERPFFALINFGETHDPYIFGNNERVPSSGVSRARKDNVFDDGFDEQGWRKQIACCEFLDSQLAIIFNQLRTLERDTIFVVCSDHGECFGEDGLYGHGFYHPKVMEVPLAIFDIRGELTPE